MNDVFGVIAAKANPSATERILTGLGGGDCGMQLLRGETYDALR